MLNITSILQNNTNEYGLINITQLKNMKSNNGTNILKCYNKFLVT
jgi:hypothetical protein